MLQRSAVLQRSAMGLSARTSVGTGGKGKGFSVSEKKADGKLAVGGKDKDGKDKADSTARGRGDGAALTGTYGDAVVTPDVEKLLQMLLDAQTVIKQQAAEMRSMRCVTGGFAVDK